MTDELTEQLPLTETTLLILLCLAPSPKHGYAIMKEVAELSEGRVNLSTGTLYGALARLLEEGWIERVAKEDLGETGHTRKEYRVTQRGQRLLAREVQRMKSLISIASLRTAEE
jgi:DNA-binding PadR family transcriptional regulator